MTGSTVFEFKILTNYVLFVLHKSVFYFFRFVTMPRNRPDVSTMSMKYFTDVFISIKKKIHWACCIQCQRISQKGCWTSGPTTSKSCRP